MPERPGACAAIPDLIETVLRAVRDGLALSPIGDDCLRELDSYVSIGPPETFNCDELAIWMISYGIRDGFEAAPACAPSTQLRLGLRLTQSPFYSLVVAGEKEIEPSREYTNEMAWYAVAYATALWDAVINYAADAATRSLGLDVGITALADLAPESIEGGCVAFSMEFQLRIT